MDWFAIIFYTIWAVLIINLNAPSWAVMSVIMLGVYELLARFF